ncbi:hypothetical protein ASPWEDRAFT_287979 [Aspergillus wentii DTO 134E9]|uniref:Uncharacterized protein n=1 Tax=Aspergillus wentii DTO 134E9 TaxID=1073089 RepID=A0A1L9S3T6_ASPWE|nr:uncharacterized protein ASPWEDRAFT_287979 [Aspergillus wentii DTO 134E9]OJJ41826.1 hypothetical protein ASPWEDRAFT_287979 [Aspergillus wentii DTO 134E9]
MVHGPESAATTLAVHVSVRFTEHGTILALPHLSCRYSRYIGYRAILGNTRFIILPPFVTEPDFSSLWVVRLSTLLDCQKCVQSFSIWAIRDGPPDEFPGQEVAEIVTRGVLLVGYMLQSSMLHAILAALCSNWIPMTKLSTVAFFLGTTMLFMRHQVDLKTAGRDISTTIFSRS